MGCTLGRITGLPSPKTIRQEGDRLRLAGEFSPTSVDEGVALAQQVVGYPSPDEEVVPFTYDATAAGGVLDGFYFVVSTQVDWAKLAAGLFSWEAELVAVPGRQAPLFEVSSLGALRTNSHSVVLAGVASWIGIPGSSLSNSEGEISAIETASGDLYFIDGTGAAYMDAAVTFGIAPADAYDAACVIEATTNGGTTWRPAIGANVGDDPMAVRITNGRVRVTWVDASPKVALTVEHYDESSNAWESTTFHVSATASAGLTNSISSLHSVTVLRNSPECVAVRFAGVGASGTPAPMIDLTLRRGAPYVEGALSDASGVGYWYGVMRSASEAATSITGGVEATSATASGNKFTILSPKAINKTVSGQSGVESTSTQTSFPFALSATNVPFPGSGNTLDDYYFAAMTHHQQVVAR